MVLIVSLRWWLKMRQRKELVHLDQTKCAELAHLDQIKSVELERLEAAKDRKFERYVAQWLLSETKELRSRYYNLALENVGHPSLKHPLAGHSWPHFGEVWDYVHVTLNHLKRYLDRYRSIADSAGKNLSWSIEEQKVFSLNENASMTEVLDVLKDHANFLQAIKDKSQVASIR